MINHWENDWQLLGFPLSGWQGACKWRLDEAFEWKLLSQVCPTRDLISLRVADENSSMLVWIMGQCLPAGDKGLAKIPPNANIPLAQILPSSPRINACLLPWIPQTGEFLGSDWRGHLCSSAGGLSGTAVHVGRGGGEEDGGQFPPSAAADEPHRALVLPTSPGPPAPAPRPPGQPLAGPPAQPTAGPAAQPPQLAQHPQAAQHFSWFFLVSVPFHSQCALTVTREAVGFFSFAFFFF